MPVELPAMDADQEEAWQAVFEIYEAMPTGWVMVGGQAVYLHAVERGAPIMRATTDADFVLNIRADSKMLLKFTGLLVKLGFASEGESLSGQQHRWVRGSAKVDVLIPRHLGEHSGKLKGVTGGSTIEAPGSQQALDRAETVEVTARNSAGKVNRPSLLGCLIGKAAALVIIDDPGRERHFTDFLTLAAVVSASDLREAEYQPADLDHLANMLGQLKNDPQLVALVPEGEEGVERIRRSVTRARKAKASSSTP